MNRFCAGFTLVLLLVPSCIIPTPRHDFAGREINEEDVEFLEVGRTTRVDVLVRFGEPDSVRMDEKVFVYRWSFTVGIFVLPGTPYGGGGAGAIRGKHFLLIEFDDEARLVRFELWSPGLFDTAKEKADEWGLDRLERARSPGPPELLLAPSPTAVGVEASALAGVGPLAIRTGSFRDRVRPRRHVGYRKALGVTMDRLVLADRTTNVLVRDAVAMAWQAAGHRSVLTGEDIAITGTVNVLALSSPTHLLTWDAVGELDVSLRIEFAPHHGGHVIERRYRSRREQATLFGPGRKHFEGVLEGCLEELMHKLSTDMELVSRLPSGPK